MDVLAQNTYGAKTTTICLAVPTTATGRIRCWKYDETEHWLVFVILLTVLLQKLMKAMME
jgi:hypothetical protein